MLLYHKPQESGCLSFLNWGAKVFSQGVLTSLDVNCIFISNIRFIFLANFVQRTKEWKSAASFSCQDWIVLLWQKQGNIFAEGQEGKQARENRITVKWGQILTPWKCHICSSVKKLVYKFHTENFRLYLFIVAKGRFFIAALICQLINSRPPPL